MGHDREAGACGEVCLELGGVPVVDLAAGDGCGRVVVEVDAGDPGWVAALVSDVELCEVYVEEVDRADEVGGGFGGVGAVER